ncbi:MAG TPA: DPP IV N-terminal domain-containing protein [Terriglobales bacterium]|nr:DPP IV N-terminal domain-containing protein [Terriglobales bacterium]
MSFWTCSAGSSTPKRGKINSRHLCAALLLTFLTGAVPLRAQVTRDDYERALSMRERYQNLALNVADAPQWIKGPGHRFWYRKTVKGGTAFVLVDADAGKRGPAFDHAKVAESLSAATGKHYTAVTLPFRMVRFDEKAFDFPLEEHHWRCDLTTSACRDLGPIPRGSFGQLLFNNDDEESPARERERTTRVSPDGKWEAYIQNFNIYIRLAKKGLGDTAKTPDPDLRSDSGAPDLSDGSFALSLDGSEENAYSVHRLWWSPDSRHIAAYRERPGYDRQVHYVESSPKDQLQPKYFSYHYEKPGDVLSLDQPVLFDLASRKQINIDNSLFPNPFELSPVEWWKDSRAFTFEYNQRGHQVYRVVEVNTETGKARDLVTESSDTFVDYPRVVANQHDHGWIYRKDIDDGKEIIWMSERDGWPHLYLIDGTTGATENQITKGPWCVRAVDWVDEAKRQIWFEASGMYPGQDPYFVNAYRINFDGTGLTRLTEGPGNHELEYSSDGKYYIDTWSTVDTAPTMELRRTADGGLVLDLEHGDLQPLVDAGWRPPQVFTAKGRDGKTDIWGVIYKPRNFDPTKKYPVIENIYAGPQGSFVPKSFTPMNEPLTELGFVVVHIDGMGTNNRSKAFHDIAWHNLKDAGFPDRILWHKAAAEKFPWYDISNGVGVFGTSAGGQNAMGALLFHPEFYKVAVSNSGSHDNRMDKIWWNELWMGWPIGPQYAASSNVDNAYRLQGKLLLVLGEMDRNVDPSSTMQVINALIKANKKFNLLYVPGGGHGAGGLYGQRLLMDFFVHNVLHEEPPDWNSQPPLPALLKPEANSR